MVYLYLYGVSVQGIQSFIFQTNKLREIAGASQLVDDINEYIFKKFCKEIIGYDIIEDNLILNAAGNIKYVIDDKKILKDIVFAFPKYIANYAPSITVSQAVVKVENGLKIALELLEERLRTQRNKVDQPVEIGFMGLERARRTGGVAFKFDKKGGIIDKGTYKKIEFYKDRNDREKLFRKAGGKDINIDKIPLEISNITGKDANSSWIAVIHADGNGLGNVIRNLVNVLNTDEQIIKGYRKFSEALNKATIEAVQNTFNKVIPQIKIGYYPIRPVILGGDDLIVIIRADLAFDFTVEFLSNFEKYTKEYFKEIETGNIEYLTACAGIAYVKSNYPFHYAIEIAEALAIKAKQFSKSEKFEKENMPPSSLAFYKIQSSFTEDLEKMIKRTHYRDNRENLFFAGPYLIKKINGYTHYIELEDKLHKLEKYMSDKSKGVSRLRQWIKEVKSNSPNHRFLMYRIKQVNSDFYQELKLEEELKKLEKNQPSILLDLIDLHTFKI